MKEGSKGIFENINDLIGTILWPVLILIFFVIYRKQISYVAQLLLNKLELSSKISVGSLSFEIEKTAKQYGNFGLGKIIKNLTEPSIRKLLTLGSGRHSMIVRGTKFTEGKSESSFIIPNDYEIFLELEKNGLVKFDEPFDGFLTFFKRLNPDERIQYKSKQGISHDHRLDLSDIKYTEFSIPVSKLSSDQFKKIDSYGLELSESGKKAFEIIVQVISEQIKKN